MTSQPATMAVGYGALVLALAFGSANGARGAEPDGGAGRVSPGHAFEFPRDHFAHPAFDSEWWYYTGNVFTESGRHFGFELTFFRKARAMERSEPSAWDLGQVWLTHFTITDTRNARFFVHERVNRAGPGIAGSDVEERRIWNGNWSIAWGRGDESRPIQVLTATSRDSSLRLSLAPRKPVVVHGREGVSRKSPSDPRAASHYLSFTRMAATGDIAIDGEEHAVAGLAWMDHEFFADYPIEGKVGWDWMSIQLDDGTDVMLFGIRDAKGGYGPDTTGTLVDAQGATRRIEFGGVSLRPGRRWRSESTGAVYPGGVEGRGSRTCAAPGRSTSDRRSGGLRRRRHHAGVLGGSGAGRGGAAGASGHRRRLPRDDRLCREDRHRGNRGRARRGRGRLLALNGRGCAKVRRRPVAARVLPFPRQPGSGNDRGRLSGFRPAGGGGSPNDVIRGSVARVYCGLG